MPLLPQALRDFPNTPFFTGNLRDPDEPGEWNVEPLDVPLIRDDMEFDIYVIRATRVDPDGKTTPCWVELNMPERISEFAFFLEKGRFHWGYQHELGGEFVPERAIDGYGQYNLFYATAKPEIGIEVLRRGLAIAKRKACIAEDLGYILRDEGRLEEAAEAFRVATSAGASNSFIWRELAAILEELGDREGAKSAKKAAKAMEADEERRLRG